MFIFFWRKYPKNLKFIGDQHLLNNFPQKNFNKSFDPFMLIKSIWAFYEKLIALQNPVHRHPNLIWIPPLAAPAAVLKYGTISWEEDFFAFLTESWHSEYHVKKMTHTW